jgi:hypothetical protein
MAQSDGVITDPRLTMNGILVQLQGMYVVRIASGGPMVVVVEFNNSKKKKKKKKTREDLECQ